jgi:RNase P subunit RPR2
MNTATIFESFILPSKGMVYEKEVNPHITLRSMTTLEEMKRLSQTDTPYKVMSDIIEACMQEKPAVHVYDMVLGDYQFLLHKLRVVTYGTDYKMLIKCNECGSVTESIADLDTLKVNEYTTDIISKKSITLPKTNTQIILRFQTPHDLDQIAYLNNEMKKKTKQNIDYSVLYTLMSLIEKVDGQILDPIALEEFVKRLPSRDANYILNSASKLASSIGVDNEISIKCGSCGTEMRTPFRITSEFFGPTTD